MGAFSAETEAFLRQAMERHSAMVYRLAYARTRNAADAQDIYQEAFLRLALCKREFADDEHVKAWLIRTTAHLSVNVVASAWRRHVTLVEYLPRERAGGTVFCAAHAAAASARRPDGAASALF